MTLVGRLHEKDVPGAVDGVDVEIERVPAVRVARGLTSLTGQTVPGKKC